MIIKWMVLCALVLYIVVAVTLPYDAPPAVWQYWATGIGVVLALPYVSETITMIVNNGEYSDRKP